MVAKKSPHANLENKKSLFTLMGFVLVLSLLFVALEWSRNDVKRYVAVDFDKDFEPDTEIPQTVEKLPPPPPPPAVLPVTQLAIVDNTTKTEEVKFSSESDETERIDIQKPLEPVKTEEETEVPFIFVEKMPEFPGNLIKFLSESIHYPQAAIETGIQGKVICEFIVNRDGSIEDVKVLRKVHPSLDKEAVRVIESMPKWIPGKQRGKPVRVKYTLPVSFKLVM